MDCWRQWVRHRTASINEYSTRYSEAIDEKDVTKPEEWRLQSTTNKQGSIDFLSKEDGGNLLSQNEELFHRQAKEVYHERLRFGIAREQARKDLPLSNYTEAFWKIDLHNLFHFLSLRLDSHAQKEIRDYANAIAVFVKDKVPTAWAAFEDYRLNAITLTGSEISILQNWFSDNNHIMNHIEKMDWVSPKEKLKREAKEFAEKLILLKIVDQDYFNKWL
tara:strand:- start:401 stop:1057 length:657 start_codon:yes stop_codon:yes gene_type:complete